MKKPVFHFSVCLLLIFAAPILTAQTPPAVNLADVVSLTLTENPSLKALGYQMQIQDARELQASIKPRPELVVQIENILGTGENQFLDAMQTTVSIAWVLERGVRERQVAAAEAGRSLVSAEIAIARLDVAAETARRYLECLYLQTRIINAQGGISLAEDAVAAIERRVDAGSAFNAELARARAELARRELVQEDIEHELLSAYYRLSAQWGESEPGFTRVMGDFFSRPEIESFETLQSRLADNPDLSKFLSQQRLQEAQLRLAEAQNRQPWQLSAGVRRLEITSDQAFVADFTMPLGKSNSNRGKVEEARTNMAITELEEAAERVRLETELFVIYQELQHSIQLSAALRDNIIPLYEEALNETQSAYEVGRYSYLALEAAQSDLLAARYDLIDASRGIFHNLIEIERITGIQVEIPQLSR